MTMQDFRGQGPPGDTGTFQSPASTIVYQYTFSGVTYTVAARQGDRGWVLVGCLPTSAANNVAVLTAAFAIGGNVYWHAATYLVNAVVPLVSNLTVEGEGWNSTIISAAGSAGGFHLLNAEGNAGSHMVNIHLLNFKTVGPSVVNAGGVWCNIRFIYSDYCGVEDVHCYSAEMSSVQFRNSTYSFVCQCYSYDHNWAAVAGAYGIGGIIISDCIIADNTVWGGRGDGGGIETDWNVTASYRNIIMGNNVHDNGGYGIRGKGEHQVIADNVVYNNTGTGYPAQINLTDKAGQIVIGNKVWCSATAGMYGIDVASSSPQSIVTGNQVYAGSFAIRCQGADSVVSSNVCHSQTGSALVASARALFVGNYLYDPANNGVVVGANSVSLIDNYIYSAGWDGISASGRSNIIVKGGVIDGSAGDGIEFLGAASSGSMILDVTLINNGAYGINISSANVSGTKVFYNTFSNNTSGAIQDLGTGTLLPSLILYFVDGTLSVTADAAPKGWSITLAANFALALGVMPPKCVQSVRIKVHAIGLAAPGAGNGMRLQVTADACQPDEAWNAEDINVTKTSDTLNFAINDGVVWTLTPADDVDIDDLVAGDQIEIKAIYAPLLGADIATNALLRCVEIQYV